MWKCATRRIKATLGKRISRNTTVLTTKTPQCQDFKILTKFAPSLAERFNRCYASYKNTCGNYSREKRDKKGPEENKGCFIGTSDCNVFEFLGWGGVLALGYYLLEPLQRRRLFPTFDSFNKPPFVPSGYQKTLQYIIDSVGVKPYNSVLPELEGAIRQTSEKLAKNSNLEEEERFTRLEKAHQKVMGTLTNWLGIQCMQSGNYKKALEYFAQADKEENASGIFNLGICHERGLGTSKNIKRAAELYQRAADLGHASAMYNLGVFYAQGIGGIKPDVSHARELFEAAASLGQIDAMKALNMEKRTPKDSDSLAVEPKKEMPVSDFVCGSILQYSNRDCESCGAEVKGSCSFNEKLDSTFDSDSGILDLSPENELEIIFA